MSTKIVKKHSFMRIISLILTISMLIGVLPSFALESKDGKQLSTAEPRTLIYNFMKGFTGDTSYTSASRITYEMMTANSEKEINKTIPSDPWAFQSTTSAQAGNSYFKYNSSNYGISMHHKGIGRLKIKVPVTGQYIPKMRFHQGTNIAVTTALYAYDAKTDAIVGSPIAEKKDIVVKDTNDYALSDTPITLEAGEYVVSIQTTRDSHIAIIDAFKLISTNGMPNLSITLPQADGLIRVNADGEIKTPIAATLSNNEAIDFSALDVQVKFGQDGIAEATTEKTTEGVMLTVRGLTEGKTTLTVSANLSGANSAQSKINVVVMPKDTVEKVHDLFYNIKKAWIKNTSADYPLTISYAMMTQGSISEVNPDMPSAPWAFFKTNSTGGNNYFKFNDKSYGLCKSQEGYGSLKIKVPTSGNYQPVAILYKGTNVPVQVRFSKYDPEKDAEGDILASKDIIVDGTKDYPLSDAQIPLEAGEYIVTLSHKTTPGLAMIDGFKLINLDKKLNISADSMFVKKGEKKEQAITVTDFEGKKIPSSEMRYSISIENQEIANIMLKEKNQSLFVCAEGITIGNTHAIIQISTPDGKSGEFKLPVSTTADFELDIGLDIPDKIKVGTDLDIPIKVHYIRNGEDGGAAPADIKVSTSNSIINASIIKNEENNTQTLKLKSTQTGTVCLTVTIQVDDVKETRKVAVLVYNDAQNTSKSYQYMICGGIPEHTQLSNVNNYFKTMPNSGEELRKNANTDTWCYAGQSENSTFVNNYDTYGSALEMGTGSWGAIKIRLPESGIYQVVSQNALYPMAGIMRVYIAPADAKNPRDPQYSIGSKDTYITGDKNTIIPVHHTNMRTINLDAGDYIVTWENIGRHPDCIASIARLYIGGLILKPVNTLPEITLKTEATPELRQFSTIEIPIQAIVADGSQEDIFGAEFEITPSVPDIVKTKLEVKENGATFLNLTATNVGTTNLDIQMKIRGIVRAKLSLPVKVLEAGKLTRVEVSVAGSELNTIPLHAIDIDKNRAQLEVHLFDQNNEEISKESASIQHATYTYASKDESRAIVDSSGLVFATMPGKVTVTVAVTMNGVTKVGEVLLNITQGKERTSYYTQEKLDNMRENVTLYPWAAKERDNAVKKAEKYIGQEERLWNAFTTQELPRSYYVGYRGDPDAAKCRYCGCDISAKYGSMYGWLRNGWDEPWKVQCPDCRRKFPSNDFGSFYQLGIDEHGNWRYELAKEKNAQLVAEGKDGYLKNILYPEKNTPEEPNWGVDDGYGYDTGRTYANGIKEVHTYISFYNHWGVWHGGVVLQAIEALESAYLYTGDVRYGRVGAIMLDRLADIYPDMDTAPYRFQLTANGSYKPHGKVVDLIWENQLAQEYCRAYDAFWPMYEDPYVVRFLSEKAKQYNMSNPKNTPELIRTNCEDGILREIFRSAKNGNIHGNFGMHQSTVALAAVSLDTMPETREMIDWVFRDGDTVPSPDSSQASLVTGGNVMRQIITSVDRNGVSNEVSPGYSDLWIGGLTRIVNALAGYDGYPDMDLYNNPRFVKMLTYQGDIILSRRSFPAIGDTGATALNKIEISNTRLIPAFENTKNPIFAQMIYFLNGNTTKGLHYSIYQKDPNKLQDDVQNIIDQYGEYDFDRSLQLPGYGFAALRSGSFYPLNGDRSYDTQRTFWMFYGRGAGHGHLDSLNLGIEAMGLNIAPDLGYPRNTTADDYYNWGQTTVAHNTVVVDDAPQHRIRTTGVPMHFDDVGRVKLMDADTAHQYNVEKYRRTVVSIDVDNEFTYGIDFFRIKGGNEHVYSFHALSDTITETEGLDHLTPQTDASGNYIGSYAGPNVPFRTEKITNGYSYLRNVDRAANVKNGNFMVDFKITDFRHQLPNPGDMHLRMTMLNGFDLNEVAITNGDPPPRDGNPETLKYILARRSGRNLDTLFTTVFEPYEGERYIEKIESISNIKHVDGSAISKDEVVRALKVTLVNGRIDYIFYSADNTIEYRIDDLFNIRGFVGVYTIKNNKNVYAYLNDGDKIGDLSGVGCVTGNVIDFTQDMAFKNTITVSLNESIDLNNLVGKYIYINKEGTGNAAYEILGATRNGEHVILDIGDITLISSVDSDGYIYNIEEGQTFRIPMNLLSENSPIFDPVPPLSVEAKSKLTYTVRATSPIDAPIIYRALTLPRGAQFDEKSGTITWTPDKMQPGIYHVAIEASDGMLESVVNFTIQVYQQTSGGSSGEIPPTPPVDPKPPVDPAKPSENYFKDLQGYDWARDAINKLAQDGVIKGTAPHYFSPALDITRADFAILMVRAFKLKEEATENFADVSEKDYFAKEVAIAKKAGIINGVGENRFNPRANITRQDMMTMIARALKQSNMVLKKADKTLLAAFDDYQEIAEYALESTALLVTNGFIAGTHNKLLPLCNTTRTEIAVLLHRILYQSEK